jgi:hypothetical protein
MPIIPNEKGEEHERYIGKFGKCTVKEDIYFNLNPA